MNPEYYHSHGIQGHRKKDDTVIKEYLEKIENLKCAVCPSMNTEMIKISGYIARLCCYDCGHVERVLGKWGMP